MINGSPKVSVIMPIKNCNSVFLEKSIKSILTQTFSDLELIIIIDDLAHLNTAEQNVIEAYKDDNRLRVIKNRRKGFVEALNCGVLSSKGEYIARLDGDDISLPNRLELQTHAINQLALDLVGGWAYVIDENDLRIGKLTPPTDPLTIRRLIMLHNPFIHSAMLFKKSILKRTGLYNKLLYGAEDYDLWLRIVSRGFAYANMPQYLINLRETSGSVMRGNHWRKIRLNYAKVKALGVTRLGYHDPLSLSFSIFTPATIFVSPKSAVRFKAMLNSIGKS